MKIHVLLEHEKDRRARFGIPTEDDPAHAVPVLSSGIDDPIIGTSGDTSGRPDDTIKAHECFDEVATAGSDSSQGFPEEIRGQGVMRLEAIKHALSILGEPKEMERGSRRCRRDLVICIWFHRETKRRSPGRWMSRASASVDDPVDQLFSR